MQLKELIASEVFWVGYGLLIGLPCIVQIILGNGFIFRDLILGSVVYTLLFPVVINFLSKK